MAVVPLQGETLVAYLQGEQAKRVRVGAEAEIVSRASPTEIHMGRVIRVAQSFQELPLPLRRNPAVIQWGVPLLIGSFSSESFYPGEIVDVRVRLD